MKEKRVGSETERVAGKV